jgi:hypothetical protein
MKAVLESYYYDIRCNNTNNTYIVEKNYISGNAVYTWRLVKIAKSNTSKPCGENDPVEKVDIKEKNWSIDAFRYMS